MLLNSNCQLEFLTLSMSSLQRKICWESYRTHSAKQHGKFQEPGGEETVMGTGLMFYWIYNTVSTCYSEQRELPATPADEDRPALSSNEHVCYATMYLQLCRLVRRSHCLMVSTDQKPEGERVADAPLKGIEGNREGNQSKCRVDHDLHTHTPVTKENLWWWLETKMNQIHLWALGPFSW